MLARLIYGFRISVLFGLLSTVSLVIGVFAGAVQGYFGGRVDLIFQRFLEIWSSIPSLFVSDHHLPRVLVPGFWTLLGVLLLFHWVYLVGVVRAEFLRGRNFEYVTAARALGSVRHADHVQAPVAECGGGDAHVPAVQAVRLHNGAHRAGFPRSRAAARVAFAWRLLAQGKANLQAPWLGLAGFISIAGL